MNEQLPAPIEPLPPEVGPGPFVLPWSPSDDRRGWFRRFVLGAVAVLVGLGAVAVGYRIFLSEDGTMDPVIEQVAPPVPTSAETTVPTTLALPTTASVRYERWDDATTANPWEQIAARPSDESFLVSEMASPVWVADRSVTRISAYFTVPQDGEYRFWVAGDDQAWLDLSKVADPADTDRIAEVLAPVTPNDFDAERSQGSAPIQLRADVVYYIEAVSLEVVLSDHVEVAWSGPTFGRQVMSGPTVQAERDDAERFLYARNGG